MTTFCEDAPLTEYFLRGGRTTFFKASYLIGQGFSSTTKKTTWISDSAL